MSDNPSPGLALYEKLVNKKNDHDDDLAEKIALLTNFKGHVKKELVDVSSIPHYFKGLLYVLDTYSFISSPQLIILAHSSLCYLVKRVAMQSPSYFDSSQIIQDLLIHLFLLNSNNNEFENKNSWNSSVKSLEAIYLVQPFVLQDCLIQLLSSSEDGEETIGKVKRKRKLFLIVGELLQINKKNNSDGSERIIKDFSPIFLEFLNNITATEEEQMETKTLTKLINDILKENVDDDLNHFIQQIHNPLIRDMFMNQADENLSSNVPIFNIESELNLILDEFQLHDNRNSGNKAVPRDSIGNSIDHLHSVLENLLVPFQNPKETEQNWKTRQSNLIEMRAILQDKFVTENQGQFLSVCKDLQLVECVGKAVLSLRTTLSMTACQLIKDFLQIFQVNLDITILDQIFTILKALLCTAKKISSNTAYNCLIIMFVNIGFHNKLFQYCLMLVNEKSTLPRNCSAILLRIFLIKYTDCKKLTPSLIYIEEWLKKGITDAHTSVREVMRITFWYYYKSYPSSAKLFLNTQFSSQLKKAIELSIPNHLEIDYQPVSSSAIASSVEHSTKSNFGFRKFPSYAQPTHSSNAFLQRMANARSSSEYIPSENDSDIHGTFKRKVSAPPSLAKRSITTGHPQFKSHVLPQHQRQQHSDTRKDLSNSDYRYDTDSSIQIDLTGDISNTHNNSLINKYMVNEEKDDLETMYQNMTASSLIKIKDGLLVLQNKLLTHSKDSATGESIDFQRIIPVIKTIMIRSPQDLKPFLSITEFLQSIPLNYLIEIHAINFLDFNEELLEVLEFNLFMETITDLIKWLGSESIENENENYPDMSLYYMKYKQFIFNFCFQLLIRCLKLRNIEKNKNAQSLIKNCIWELAKILGQEFDESLYFDSLYHLYLSDSETFIGAMRVITSVSTKLKICNELKLRDKEDNFHIEDIISRQSSSGPIHDTETAFTNEGEAKGNLNDGTEACDLIDDRKFMEMTMVNPFNQNRSTSASSVVHHDPPATKMYDDEYVETRQDELNEPRLSEITKVVSVYEIPQSRRSITASIDRDGDLQMNDEREQTVNLSEIFGNADEQEHTVKFSNEPPRIINPCSRASSTRTSDLITDIKEDENDVTRKASQERDKSPVTPLTDHQSKELSQGINSIDISKRNDMKDDISDQPNLSSEILVNAMLETDNYRTKNHFDLSQEIQTESLTYHEIWSAMAMIDDSDDAKFYIKQMKRAITRIKKCSFTIKHLNYVIGPLIHFLHEEKMKEWLEFESGYDELFQLSKMLLYSTDETSLIPVNMACKSIVLIECLILINKHLKSASPLSPSAFSDIWDYAVLMAGKIPDYSNEIYVLLQELRDLLSDLGFFNATYITAIVSNLGTKNEKTTSGIVETFLMETLSIILLKDANFIQGHQFPEIIPTMLPFIVSERTEWRCASANVLANVLKRLRSAGVRYDEIEIQFQCLAKADMQLVTFLASRKTETR